MERTYAVAYAERPLIRQFFGTDGFSVQAACHHGKGTVPALPRFLTKAFRIIQQLAESGFSHGFHNPLIISRPLFPVPVRAVLLQPVGQIPAGDHHRATPQLVCCLFDKHSRPIMIGFGQAGQPYADKAVLLQIFIYKI